MGPSETLETLSYTCPIYPRVPSTVTVAPRSPRDRLLSLTDDKVDQTSHESLAIGTVYGPVTNGRGNIGLKMWIHFWRMQNSKIEPLKSSGS